MTFFNIIPERWNELVHLTFFVFLCTLDKRHVYFLHLFLHLHQLCWSDCVFFFYVYISTSSFYCLSSFRKVRTGIWSYLHSWEEVLNQLNQPGIGRWLGSRDALLKRVSSWTSVWIIVLCRTSWIWARKRLRLFCTR